jgi:pyruvate/2-oxoglutarate dehydrogenase complex dihydrolipoamide dehydrogenase (E3) component
MESYEVVVVGAGLGGINAAAQAAALGARVALVEANKIGGT